MQQITDIRYERGAITTDLLDNKEIVQTTLCPHI